jgi:hypothetical protein
MSSTADAEVAKRMASSDEPEPESDEASSDPLPSDITSVVSCMIFDKISGTQRFTTACLSSDSDPISSER